MSLFKPLKGDSSRISLDITPFHDGWAYFTPDNGGFYIDCEVNGEQKRIRVKSPSEGGGSSSAIYGTLRADAWQNSQQKLLVDGLTATQNGVIGVTHNITDEQLLACANGGLYVCDQGEGYLMIALSGDTPPYDIPVVVILLD